MTKECAPAELVGAVRKVVSGGHYVSAALAEKMASFLALDVQTPPHELECEDHQHLSNPDS
jgi:DNA-binding NarL/FixJ family response regulator